MKNLVIHILNETMSPPDSEVWLMLCGAFCLVDEETSELTPPMDFVLPGGDITRATCDRCCR